MSLRRESQEEKQENIAPQKPSGKGLLEGGSGQLCLARLSKLKAEN